jgi:hypothetical protein
VQPTNVLSQDELLSLFTYAAAPEDHKPRTPFVSREREGGGSKVTVEEFGWSNKLSNMARVRFEGPKVVSIAPTCNGDVMAIADTKGTTAAPVLVCSVLCANPLCAPHRCRLVERYPLLAH